MASSPDCPFWGVGISGFGGLGFRVGISFLKDLGFRVLRRLGVSAWWGFQDVRLLWVSGLGEAFKRVGLLVSDVSLLA